MDANKQFTISEETQALLAIYKDFNAVTNRLFSLFENMGSEKEEEKPAGGLFPNKYNVENDDEEEKARKQAESLFKPFKEHVEAIYKELMKRIDARISWALSDGGGTEI